MIEKLHILISITNTYHYFDIKNNDKLICVADGLLRSYIKNNKVEPAIYERSIFIATEIAKKRFDCDTVIAALFCLLPIKDVEALFSSIKDDKNSHSRIMGVLSAYKDFNSKLNKLYQLSQKELPKHHIGNISDIDPKAFAIKVAQQKELLSNEVLENENKLESAQYVGKFLVPQMQLIGAFKDADDLLELCLKLENRVVYDALQNQLLQCKKLRGDLYRNTLIKLKKTFDPDNKLIPKELHDFQKRIKEFIYNERAIYSMYRYMCYKKKEHIDELDNTILQNKIAIYDCTLIMRDTEEAYSVIDVFFEYYNQVLRDERIYIVNYYQTTYKDSSYFILCDEMDNKYRLFIRSETEYLHYLYGDIMEKESISFLSQSYESKINVYKKDGEVETIVNGATVLDLAFKIHGDLGLCFDYALINNNPEHRSAYTVLNKGDTVEIFKKDIITAELKWFRYIKTDTALYQLYRYFNSEFNRLKKDNRIDVITKDNTIQTLKYGSTALDFAFSIHEELGLQFSYALINNSNTHMPAYTQLSQGDKVIIVSNEKVAPSIQWFKYVRTENAIRSLVKYFQKVYSL